MSLNYSFINENTLNTNNKSKPEESLASKVKRRLKRKNNDKRPIAQYEVFEDSDNELLGQFDVDVADHQMSKMDSGSGALHAKSKDVASREKPVAPVQLPPKETQSEYIKHYNNPGFHAIMKDNDSNQTNQNEPIRLSPIQPSLQTMPIYGTSVPSVGNNQELLTKLNYLIHLLEDQKDERVGSITEELVLYCFLGVFIIFVLDSFVKVGKYVR